MATELQNISALARQTTERLTQSVDNWKRFLDSAAWLYKYPFHEQVLIHAQRPDAKACAPIELWNSRFRRWVNRGAKGIALIDDSGHKPALRYGHCRLSSLNSALQRPKNRKSFPGTWAGAVCRKLLKKTMQHGQMSFRNSSKRCHPRNTKLLVLPC